MGGKNTKFIPISASQRLRKNKIFTLTHNGHDFTSHHQKAKILRDFFIFPIGTPANTSWSFEMHEIYPNHVNDLHILDESFSKAEIKNAFFQMNPQASPTLMDLGPPSTDPTGPLLKASFYLFSPNFI